MPDTVQQLIAQCRAGTIEEQDRAVEALLQDEDYLVRSRAIAALGYLAYQPAAPLIATLLQEDPDELVRAEAAETLGDLGARAALPALQAALAQDPDESVRAYAAIAIGLLEDPASPAWLQERQADEPSLRVQVEILGARYRLGDTAALPPLLALLATADEDLATRMLNVFDDLLTRRPLPAVRADAAAIEAALDAVGARAPILQGHVEKLRDHLPRA